MRRFSIALVLPVLLSVAMSASQGADPPAKSPAKKPAAKKYKSDQEEWKALLGRRDEIMKEAQATYQKAQSAKDANERQKAQGRLNELQEEFGSELQPRILELAPRILKLDPSDKEAANIEVGRAFGENRYKDVIAIVGGLPDQGKETPPIRSALGVSQFATHDFEAAKKTLGEASKSDQQLFPRIGGPQFLAVCDEYVELWKKEQEIRAKEKKADDLPRVLLKTTRGDIELELFENEAPNTVANFISLVEAGKYDGVAFHRVLPNFMAQGGDPNTLDNDPSNDGQGGPGYTIPCECYNGKARMHFQGSLSMAHAGRDTGGSQFFLTHLPTAHINYKPGKAQSNHTVFGRIVKGLDVLLSLPRVDPQAGEPPIDKIESAVVLRKRDHKYVPETLADKRKRDAKRESKDQDK